MTQDPQAAGQNLADAVWTAHNLFIELMSALNSDSGLAQLKAILTEHFGNAKQAETLIQSCQAAVAVVKAANTQVLQALTEEGGA